MTGEAQQDIDTGTGEEVTPGKPADHVDMADGASVGHTATPEHVEGADGNQDPPAPAEPVVEPKTSRDEIYGKAAQHRENEIASTLEDMTPEQRIDYQRMVAEAGGGPDPYAGAEVDPATGQPVVAPAEPGAEPPAAAAPPAVPAAEPAPGQPAVAPVLDPNAEMTTIVVYGMREDVPTADINAAGGANAYQKNRAADIRLQRLSTYEASLRSLDSQLSERAASLERGERPPAQPGTGITEPSPTDAQGGTDVDVLAEGVARGVFSGDVDEARQTIAAALASVRDDAIRAAQTVVESSVPTGPSPAELNAERQARERANAVFRDEFSDLNSDVLRKAVFSMVQEVAQDPIMLGRPLDEITREAGSRVRLGAFGSDYVPNETAAVPVVPGATPPTPLITGAAAPIPTNLRDRMALKSRTVVSPLTPAHGRVPTQEPAGQKFPSKSEYVAQLKTNRNQP